MPDANIMSHSDHMTGTLFEINKIVWRMSNNLIIVALDYLVVKILATLLKYSAVSLLSARPLAAPYYI